MQLLVFLMCCSNFQHHLFWSWNFVFFTPKSAVTASHAFCPWVYRPLAYIHIYTQSLIRNLSIGWLCVVSAAFVFVFRQCELWCLFVSYIDRASNRLYNSEFVAKKSTYHKCNTAWIVLVGFWCCTTFECRTMTATIKSIIKQSICVIKFMRHELHIKIIAFICSCYYTLKLAFRWIPIVLVWTHKLVIKDRISMLNALNKLRSNLHYSISVVHQMCRVK